MKAKKTVKKSAGSAKTTRVKSTVKKTKTKVTKVSRSKMPTDFKPFLDAPIADNLPALTKGKQQVGESKFFISPSAVAVEERETYDLPSGYADTRIVIQVRDPYWLYAYWEVNPNKWDGLRQELGEALDSSKRVLRIYDITGVQFNGSNSNGFFDIDINDFAANWYINIGTPGRGYCVDLGLILADGRFITIARSNCVTTPLDGPSNLTDEEWMIVEEDFNKLYGLSVGLGVGLSSADIREQISERLKKEISSGAVSSFGSPVKKAAKRGFWMVVNTELIVYGATEPDAAVTVQGRPIKLKKDGTFSLRFALPDGEQVIPVKGVSADKVEERVITPIVTRRTV
ncbi:MAG: DUF4912 domain-containing protein [Candidatus Omnitrophota bacterium]